MTSKGSLPVIDIQSLVEGEDEVAMKATVDAISNACLNFGFFYISGHGVMPSLISKLKLLSRKFFALPEEEKMKISMEHGGKAWRGYFPIGGEFTSGLPDQKEGIYFGTEGSESDPRPLHGRNLFPEGLDGEELRVVVTEYMKEMKRVGNVVLSAIAASLGVDPQHFGPQFENPTELFRIFNYPPHNGSKFGEFSMGVGEHTDYGYVTILFQDDEVENDGEGGLQVRDLFTDEWITASPIPGTFVINLGDAIEHNTGGLVRATPHRVLQRIGAQKDRLSFPYFYDPSFDAPMTSVVPFLQGECKQRLEDIKTKRASHGRGLYRWDEKDPSQFQGTYGSYLLGKVAKVFPDLAQQEHLPTL